MKKRSFEKKPLYRKVNSRTHGVRHGIGGKARWDRNTKAEVTNEALQSPMRSGLKHGLDYTPLFRFLLGKVGSQWDPIHAEALQRLPQEEPIWFMVARTAGDKKPLFRSGESSFFSGLFVNEANLLQLVAPEIANDCLWPGCSCCTHTFNGKAFVNVFETGREASIINLLAEYHDRISS